MPVNFQDVLKLGLPQGSYAVFGSGPMAVRGMRDAVDIDLIVTDELWQQYAATGKYRIEKGFDLIMHDVSLIADWKKWFPDNLPLIESADIIDGLPFVKLSYVLEWKRALGREKDLRDIALIQEYLGRGGR